MDIRSGCYYGYGTTGMQWGQFSTARWERVLQKVLAHTRLEFRSSNVIWRIHIEFPSLYASNDGADLTHTQAFKKWKIEAQQWHFPLAKSLLWVPSPRMAHNPHNEFELPSTVPFAVMRTTNTLMYQLVQNHYSNSSWIFPMKMSNRKLAIFSSY